jgi:tetratricopeptide (TPR) repeat protein
MILGKISGCIDKFWGSLAIRQRRIGAVILLLLAGAAVYSNSFSAPFILDDLPSIEWIVKHSLLEHLLHGSMRRVTDISLAVNYQLGGFQVAGYHVVNLAIHLATSIILYFIIISAVSALRASYPAQTDSPDGAWLLDEFLPLTIALLFVIHPVQTQAVTYIIQRYTSMAALFYLAATLFFIRARLASVRDKARWKPWLLGAGALVSGVLGLGSKQITATLPLMLLVLECYLFNGRLFRRRFFVLCGSLSIILLVVVYNKWHGNLGDFLFDLRRATTEAPFFPRTSYFLTQTRVVVTYLRLLFLPIDQALMRDSPIYTSLFSLPVAASLVLHCLLVAVAVFLFRQSGRNLRSHDWLRGVFQRLASLGIFWFYIALSIESSFIPIRDVIFEHRMYLPSAGFFTTVIALAALAVHDTRTSVKTAWIAVACICLLLGGMTVARNNIWSSSFTLWQDCVSKAPNNWLALINLAAEYNMKNMPEKSIPLLVRAFELQPAARVLDRIELGIALQELHRYGSRFTTGHEFLLPQGEDGTYSLDFSKYAKMDSAFKNNMGLAYEYLGQTDKAMNAYGLAVAIDPAYDLAWYNQALLAYRIGDMPKLSDSIVHLKTLNLSLANSLISKMFNQAIVVH